MTTTDESMPDHAAVRRPSPLARLRPLLAVLLAFAAYRATPSTRPANLGARDGRLADCPGSPNCVSSRSERPGEAIAPIPFEGSADDALARVRAALATLPRTVVVAEAPGYLHAEATSLVFGFVDDLEVLADDGAKVLHVRSASRVGHSDLGVNRDRVERLRRAYDAVSAGARAARPSSSS
jgi:uncharacterized protein (DUF1499 family)